MKRALVIGLGVSGSAVIPYLAARGYEVYGYDDVLSANDPLPDSESFDLVVVSPGIPPTHPLYKGEVIGEAELVLRDFQGTAVGITGTNGKTTTTLLVTHILNRAGIPARALGNVGVPLTTIRDDEVAVIELSSYQLETMRSPVLDAAVVLNITPDHLDRYGTIEKYAQAKARIEQCLKESAPLYASKTCAPYLSSFIPLESIDTLCYSGSNYAAAFALCRHLGISDEVIEGGLRSFRCPPHRMEVVGEIDGVTYINDSKGTNVVATQHALAQLDGPIVLIAGGRHKGSSYEPWKRFKGKVEAICVIGEAKDEIVRDVGTTFTIIDCASLEEAIACAQERLQPGSTLLLSPGCSSFDMFRNFEVRGDKFRELVQQVEEKS